MHSPYLARFASAAALIAPEKTTTFEACLAGLNIAMASEQGRELMASANEDFWYPSDDWRARFRPYVVTDGILAIPVKGVLLHDFSWQYGDWATGYVYIQKAFERGMADASVKGVALVIDSPGGEVAGNFDLVDRMYAAKTGKPVRAFAAESAYSAAYSIASVADQIVVSRTGGVGSIGVVTSHVDYSKAMSDAGVKVTFIFAGKHKVDGNPYQELPDDVKGRIQGRINALYDVFVSTVARNRGMEEQVIRNTEALTFSASEAVENGLADAVGALDEGLTAFSSELATSQGAEQMSEQNTENTAALDQSRREGAAEGAKTERARIKAIVESDAAKTRASAALTIALTTDLSVDQAAALLGNLPEDKAEAPTNTVAQGQSPFEAAMANGNPNLGSGDGSTSAKSDDLDGFFASAGIPKK